MVSFSFYSDRTCCAANIAILPGTLEDCHNSDKNFGSFTEAVGAKMFDRDIRVEAYQSPDCEGDLLNLFLSNKERRRNMTGKDAGYISYRFRAPPPPVCVEKGGQQLRSHRHLGIAQRLQLLRLLKGKQFSAW